MVSRLPIGIAHILDLAEAGDGVAHMVGVDQRLLALLREGKRRIGQVVALLGRQLASDGVGLPGGCHANLHR
jgi:hypothetical protein